MKPAKTERCRRRHIGLLPMVLAPLLFTVGLLVLVGCAGVEPSSGTSSASAGSQGGAAAAARPPAADEVRLVVSHDFGDTVSHDVLVTFKKGTTALQLLAEQADVETGYGGGFVTAVDGQKSTFGDSDEAADWFFWIDGRMGSTGAGDLKLQGGQTVWWDCHRWQGAMFIPAALEAFPRPWSQGDMTLAGDVAGESVAAWAEQHDLTIAGRVGLDREPPGDAVVTASPAQVAATPWLRDLLDQKNDLGIFVEVRAGEIWALDHRGEPTQRVTAAMIAAPNPAAEQSTLLVLIGGDEPALVQLLERAGSRLGAAADIGLSVAGGGLLPLPDDH